MPETPAREVGVTATRKLARQWVMRVSILTFLLAAHAAFAQPVPSNPSSTQARFDDWINRYADATMRVDTDAAAARRYFLTSDPKFEDSIERQISPRTQAYRGLRYNLQRRGLTELNAFPSSQLSEQQRTWAHIIRWDLEVQLEGRAFDDYSFPFTQGGPQTPQTGLVSLLTVGHPLVTARDAENYVARLKLLAPRMDESVAEGRRLTAKKLLPPSFILEVVAKQIRNFVDIPPAKNPLVTTFATRTANMKDLSAERRRELLATTQQLTTDAVYPAWKRALDLVDGAIPHATRDAGLWRFPNGVEAYDYKLKLFTTTKLKAHYIHQLGLKMVAELEGRMDTVLRQIGYAEGSVRARMDKMRGNQRQFPNTEEGRAQYKAYIADILKDAERRAPLLFDRVPKMPVIAQAYPDFMGARAPSYTLGAIDGSRPGTYQYPVVDVSLIKFGVRTVVYHEAVPGHHFQGALQAEDTALPRFLQDRIWGNNSAIGEGWGLYAERLAAEEGWYEGDLVGLLGELDSEAFRARRLVVDTGIHTMHWTREQAIEYLGPNPAGSAVAEVERYIANPGQACSYMIGELKIVELRERAKQALGTRFSLREFHNRVLGAGRVPLDILEAEINRWIEMKERA